MSLQLLPSVSARSEEEGQPLRHRVLVIDDEPLLLHSMARVLREYDVLAFADPLEALPTLAEPASSADVALVLCDLHMPRLSGPDLYREVVDRHPQLAPRFVFVSGDLGHGDAESFLAALPNDRLEKPFSFQLLRDLAARYAARPR